MHSHSPGSNLPSVPRRSRSVDHARIGPAHTHGREPPSLFGSTRALTYTSSSSAPAADGTAAAFCAFWAARSVPSGSVAMSERAPPAPSHSSKSASIITGTTTPLADSKGCVSLRS